MTKHTTYLVEETRWLLSFRTPPLEIAKALHRAPASLYNMALKHKLSDIQEAFIPYAKVKAS